MARMQVAVAEESASDAAAMAGAVVQPPRLSEVGDV
jgi:hypothetical protein